ncbi:hypothetical protein [Terrimonas ferruginea]|uniref:hypothetical protein n=1 Tax=Terrimonas ferruginea TaxID=249 RepID=UPI0003FE6C33|nr:hypothetical protein [Terrimonas ferruginea]
MSGKTDNNWIQRLAGEESTPAIIDFLVNQLDGSSLNSLLLEVFSQRLKQETPADLLRRYKNNRLVQPSCADLLRLRRLEMDFLEMAAQKQIALIELSTAAAAGTCSLMGPVHQHKILTALRQTEVLADATNSMALHDASIAQRKEMRHYATAARLLRTPLSAVKGHSPHFLAGCLLSAGPDKGDFIFEKQSLLLHLQLLADFLQQTGNPVTRFKLIIRNNIDHAERLTKACADFMATSQSTPVDLINTDSPHDYYKGCQFKVCIKIDGNEIEIADGGFTDWSALLLQDKKQRTLISGLGLEYLCHLTAQDAQRKSHI